MSDCTCQTQTTDFVDITKSMTIHTLSMAKCDVLTRMNIHDALYCIEVRKNDFSNLEIIYYKLIYIMHYFFIMSNLLLKVHECYYFLFLVSFTFE